MEETKTDNAAMKKKLLLAVGIVVVIAVCAIYIGVKQQRTARFHKAVATYTADQPCKPTFKDGGGPYYLPDAPFRTNIAPDADGGDTLVVSGQLLESDCITPIADGVIDIWQASAEGKYEDEWYRGQVRSDNNGYYTFQTIIPKGYGEGTGYRPPHIHFKVHVDGTEAITSQMFFPAISGTPGFDDAYIMHVEIEESNETNGSKDELMYYGYHHIILP